MPINLLTEEGFGMIVGSAGESFTGLLDTYGGAAAAYSVRRLSSTYTGALIEVRRSSDNTTQDIGYDANGDLDTAALLAFVGAGDGFVRTWYDQSGNANNAQQTTTSIQPQIVSSGNLILENSKPVIHFTTASNQWFALNSDINSIDDWSIFEVKKKLTNNSVGLSIQNSANSAAPYPIWDYSDGNIYIRNRMGYRTATGNNTNQISAESYSVSAVISAYINNSSLTLSLLTLGPNTVNWNSIGRRLTDYGKGYYQELIVYKANQTSNRDGIQLNVNNYYSIY